MRRCRSQTFSLAGLQTGAEEGAQRAVGDRLHVVTLACHEHMFGVFGPTQHQQRPVAAEWDSYRIAVHPVEFDKHGERVAGHARPPPQGLTASRSGNDRRVHILVLHRDPHPSGTWDESDERHVSPGLPEVCLRPID